MVWERLLGKDMYQASPHKATPTTRSNLLARGAAVKC